jgi:hypothetical protein
VPVPASPPTLVSWEQADTFALVVALNQDRIIAALDADITARARDAEAMDPEQKESALAAVADEQLPLDRSLAELVFLAHAESLGGIELRADTHPLAVLSLALVPVPHGEGTPGTTPGYSWDFGDEIVQAGTAPEKENGPQFRRPVSNR